MTTTPWPPSRPRPPRRPHRDDRRRRPRPLPRRPARRPTPPRHPRPPPPAGLPPPRPPPAATSPAPTRRPTRRPWRGRRRSTRRQPFDEKAPFIEAPPSLRSTIDAYAATGTQMGGITLVPTDVVVIGPTRRSRTTSTSPASRRTATRRAPSLVDGRGSSAATSSAPSWPSPGAPARHDRGRPRLPAANGTSADGGDGGPQVALGLGLLVAIGVLVLVALAERRRRRQADPAAHRPRRPVRLRPDEQRPPDRPLAARARARSSACSSASRSASPAR